MGNEMSKGSQRPHTLDEALRRAFYTRSIEVNCELYARLVRDKRDLLAALKAARPFLCDWLASQDTLTQADAAIAKAEH